MRQVASKRHHRLSGKWHSGKASVSLSNWFIVCINSVWRAGAHPADTCTLRLPCEGVDSRCSSTFLLERDQRSTCCYLIGQHVNCNDISTPLFAALRLPRCRILGLKWRLRLLWIIITSIAVLPCCCAMLLPLKIFRCTFNDCLPFL